MNLSFAGCGFLGIYHIGVASSFREYAPHVLLNKISGASVGSLAAVALLCGVPLGQTTTDVLRVAVKARARALGPLHPGFELNEIIKDGLVKALPENAHILCSGRLFISCTRVSDMKNVLLSEFESKDDLIQALLCSCFIPFYSALRIPKFHGEYYIDGGFSNNLPVLDKNTITISPFVGEHDICPQDDSCSVLQISITNTSVSVCPGNMYRFARILFPPHPEILSKMCQQGFDDALKFLQRHNLITCTRCMAVQSSLTLSDVHSDEKHKSEGKKHDHDDCIDCRHRRQMALLDSLPEAVVNAIQEACDQVNKGIINWLFRHRPMKLLSILGLPYVLPIDISILIFCKVWQSLPSLQKEIQNKFDNILTLIKSFVHKIDDKRQLYNAKFSCQLAITEFDYTEESVFSSYGMQSSEKRPHDTCKVVSETDSMKSQVHLDVPDSAVPQLDVKRQRKSYAGFLNTTKELNTDAKRRKSVCDFRQPQRVIRNMKFGFTVDLAPTHSASKQSMVEAFQSLREDDSELHVIDITNKALNWEQEYLKKYHGDLEPENAGTLEKLLDATTNEAVMSYYYLDDNETVKVTELYNVDDADTSAVLSEDERETNNKLQWENEWVSDPNITCCDLSSIGASKTFSDKSIDIDLGVGDCSEFHDESYDTVSDFQIKEQNIASDVSPSSSSPKRKTSFIFIK